MPIYTIEAPDGKTYEIEGPEGASQADVARAVLAQNPEAGKPPKQHGVLESVGSGIAGGIANAFIGTGAAVADYTGASDTAKYLDEQREKVRAWQKEHGSESLAGMTGEVVGGMSPALGIQAAGTALAPATAGASLLVAEAVNAGLFGLPAFRDTYKAQKAEGASDGVALSHAAKEALLATVGGRVIGKGGTKLFGETEQVLKKMAAAGAEGVAFTEASRAGEKAIDAAAGRKNEKSWIADPKEMAASALGFGALRGAHHAMTAPARARAADAKAEADAKAAAAAARQQAELDAQRGGKSYTTAEDSGETLQPSSVTQQAQQARDAQQAQYWQQHDAAEAAKVQADKDFQAAQAQGNVEEMRKQQAAYREAERAQQEALSKINTERPTAPEAPPAGPEGMTDEQLAARAQELQGSGKKKGLIAKMWGEKNHDAVEQFTQELSDIQAELQRRQAERDQAAYDADSKNRAKTDVARAIADFKARNLSAEELAAQRRAPAVTKAEESGELPVKRHTAEDAQRYVQERATGTEIEGMERGHINTGVSDQYSLFPEAPKTQTYTEQRDTLIKQLRAARKAKDSDGVDRAIEALRSLKSGNAAPEGSSTRGAPALAEVLGMQKPTVLEGAQGTEGEKLLAHRVEPLLPPGVERTYTPNNADAASVQEQIQRLPQQDAATEALLKRIQDNLYAIASHPNNGRLIPDPRNPGQRVHMQGPLDMVADWLHGLQTGRATRPVADAGHADNFRTRDVTDMLDAIENTRLPNRHDDMFPESTVREHDLPSTEVGPTSRPHAFDSLEAFRQFLTKDGPKYLRDSIHAHLFAARTAVRGVDAIDRKIEQLAESAKAVEEKHEYALKHTEMAKGQPPQRENPFDAVYEAAQKRLAAVMEKLDAEIAPFRKKYESLKADFARTQQYIQKVTELVNEENRKYRITAPEFTPVLENLYKAQRDLVESMQADVTKENWDNMRSNQRVVSNLLKYIADHNKGVTSAYLSKYEAFSKTLEGEIDTLQKLSQKIAKAEKALADNPDIKRIRRNQQRRVGTKQAVAEVKVAEELRAKHDAETAAARAGTVSRLQTSEKDMQAQADALRAKADKERAEGMAPIDAERAQLEKDKADMAAKQAAARDVYETPIPEEKRTTLSEREDADAAKRKAENERAERLASLPTTQVTFEALEKARNTVNSERKREIQRLLNDPETTEEMRKKYVTELHKIERAERYLENNTGGALDAEGNPLNPERLKLEQEQARLLKKENPTKKDKRRLTALGNLLTKTRAHKEAKVMSADEKRAEAEAYLKEDYELDADSREADQVARIAATQTQGRTGPALKNKTVAGDTRTGSDESKGKVTTPAGEPITPKTGARNKITEPPLRNERDVPMTSKEMKAANEAADEAGVTTPRGTTTQEDIRAEAQTAQAEERLAATLRRQAAQAKDAWDAYQKLDPRKRSESKLASLEIDYNRIKSEADSAQKAVDARAKRNAEEAERLKGEDQASREDAEAGTKEAFDMEDFDSVPDDTFVSYNDFAGEGEISNFRGTSGKNDVPLSDTTIDTLGKGDIKGAVEDIAANSKDAMTRRIASNLVAHLEGVESKLVEDMPGGDKITDAAERKAHEDAPGGITKDGKRVFINSRTGLSENSVVHEGAHAATMRELSKPESELTKEQREAKRELEAMHEQIKGADELDNTVVKQDDLKEFVAEGMASNRVREYMQNTGWKNRGNMWQRFKQAILKILGIKTPPDGPMLERFLQLSEKFLAAPGGERSKETAVANLRKQGDLGPHAGSAIDFNKGAQQKGKKPNISDAFTYLTADMHIYAEKALRLAGKAAKAAGNKAGEFDAEQAEMSLRETGRSNVLVQASMAHGAPELFRDSKGFGAIVAGTSNPGADFFKAVRAVPGKLDAQGKFDLVSNYMAAVRGLRVGPNKIGIDPATGNFFTRQKLQAAVDYVRNDPALYKAVENARDAYHRYNEKLVKTAADSGVFTPQEVQEMLQHRDYVPLYREHNGQLQGIIGNRYVSMGDISHTPFMHKLKGGNEMFLPINESIFYNTKLLLDMALVNNAKRNMAKVLVYAGATKNKMGVQAGKGPSSTDNKNVLRWEEGGVDKHTIIDTTGTSLEGVPTEMLAQSIEGYHATIPGVLKWAQKANDLLRAGVTRMPLYTLRQLTRDPISAAMVTGLKGTPLKAVVSAFKSYGSEMFLGGKESEKLAKHGLVHNNIMTGDHDDMVMLARQMAGGDAPNAIRQVLNILDRSARTADAATKIQIYKDSIAQGLSENQAAHRVQEAMNFHKRGASGTIQQANRMLVFFNSGVQGINSAARALRGNMPYNEQLKIRSKYITSSLLMFAAGAAYATLMNQDDEYKNLKMKDKVGNLHFYGPDGTMYKLPIGFFEAGGGVWAAGQALASMIDDTTDGKTAEAALLHYAKTVIPGGGGLPMIPGVKQVGEWWLNKDFRTGEDIVSRRLAGKTPDQQFNAQTPTMLREFGRATGVSPIQMQHMLNGLFGSGVDAAMQLLDMVAPMGTTERSAKGAEKTPFLSGLIQNPDSDANEDALYDAASKASAAKQTLDDMKNRGRSAAEIKEYFDAHREDIILDKVTGPFVQKMGELNKAIDQIENSSRTPEEKRDRIKELKAIRKRVAAKYKEALDRVKDRLTTEPA